MRPRRARSRPALALLVVLAIGAPIALSTAQAPVACDPIQTTPVYDPSVPTGEDVPSLGFEIGSQEVTSQQANDHIAAVDTASNRVISGTAAQPSWART